MDCGLVTKNRNYTCAGQLAAGGRGNFLVYINPKYVFRYPTGRGFGSNDDRSGGGGGGGAVFTGLGGKNMPMGCDIAVDDDDDNDGEEEKAVLRNVLPPSSNRNKDLYPINNQVDAVDKCRGFASLPTGGNNKVQSKQIMLFQGGGSGHRQEYLQKLHAHCKKATQNFHVEHIWAAVRRKLYTTSYFNVETVAHSQKLIHLHHDFLCKKVVVWWQKMIKRYTSLEKCLKLNERMRADRLKYASNKLLMPYLTLFRACMAAIRIQSNFCPKKAVKTYYPIIFFAEYYGFKRCLDFARKEYVQMRQYKTKNTARGQLCQAKLLLEHYLTLIYTRYNQEGI